MVYEACCMWTSMMMSLLCMWTRSSKNGCRERPLCLFLWQEVVSRIVLWETAKKKKKRDLNGRCWKVDGQYLKQKDGCRTVIHLTSQGVCVGRGECLNNSWLQRHIWGNGDQQGLWGSAQRDTQVPWAVLGKWNSHISNEKILFNYFFFRYFAYLHCWYHFRELFVLLFTDMSLLLLLQLLCFYVC